MFKSTIVWKCQKSRTARGATKAASIFQSTWHVGDNISVHPRHKKGQASNWDNSKYTQALTRMGSEHMHAPSVTQARPRYSHICTYCWHLKQDTALFHPPHCSIERRRNNRRTSDPGADCKVIEVVCYRYTNWWNCFCTSKKKINNNKSKLFLWLNKKKIQVKTSLKGCCTQKQTNKQTNST